MFSMKDASEREVEEKGEGEEEEGEREEEWEVGLVQTEEERDHFNGAKEGEMDEVREIEGKKDVVREEEREWRSRCPSAKSLLLAAFVLFVAYLGLYVIAVSLVYRPLQCANVCGHTNTTKKERGIDLEREGKTERNCSTLFDFRIMGTHNRHFHYYLFSFSHRFVVVSYHLEPPLKFLSPMQYNHLSLHDQLEDFTIRSVELDLHYVSGTYMVYHVQIYDDHTSCYCLRSCLQIIHVWKPFSLFS